MSWRFRSQFDYGNVISVWRWPRRLPMKLLIVRTREALKTPKQLAVHTASILFKDNAAMNGRTSGVHSRCHSHRRQYGGTSCRGLCRGATSQKLCVYPVPFLKHGEFLVENRNFLTSRLFNASSPLGDSTGFSSRFFASKLISFGYRVAWAAW